MFGVSSLFYFLCPFCKSAVSGCTFAATSWQHQKLYLSLSGSECSALEPTSEEKMNGKQKELDVYVACPVTVLRTRVIVNFLLQHDDIVNVLVHHVFIPMQYGNEAINTNCFDCYRMVGQETSNLHLMLVLLDTSQFCKIYYACNCILFCSKVTKKLFLLFMGFCNY